MNEIIEIIVNYASIWAPSLCAILGIGVTVITAMAKVRSAIAEFKKEEVMQELSTQLAEQNKQNAELVRCNKLLLDKITKIQNYSEEVKNEHNK